MFDLNLIGARIRELRKKKRLSQEELAELIDVNFRTIQRIETGGNVPSLLTIAKLTEVLGVNFEDVFATEHLASREEILKQINDIASKMDDESLKKLYKAIYYFYN